ncbi:hypothetical protein KI387_034160, partial [Taxus chinensis]
MSCDEIQLVDYSEDPTTNLRFFVSEGLQLNEAPQQYSLSDTLYMLHSSGFPKLSEIKGPVENMYRRNAKKMVNFRSKCNTPDGCFDSMLCEVGFGCLEPNNFEIDNPHHSTTAPIFPSSKDKNKPTSPMKELDYDAKFLPVVSARDYGQGASEKGLGLIGFYLDLDALTGEYQESAAITPARGKNPCRKSYKVIKRKESKLKLVVGEDIHVDHISQLLGKTLTGKIFGRQIASTTLNDWLQRNYHLLIGYGPFYHILTRGWISFSFQTERDAEKILGGHQFWGSAIFSLKPWHPIFDPLLEPATCFPILVKSPGSPWEL